VIVLRIKAELDFEVQVVLRSGAWVYVDNGKAGDSYVTDKATVRDGTVV